MIRSHGKHRTELDGRRESQNTEIYSKEFRRKGVFFNHGLNGLNGYEADRKCSWRTWLYAMIGISDFYSEKHVFKIKS